MCIAIKIGYTHGDMGLGVDYDETKKQNYNYFLTLYKKKNGTFQKVISPVLDMNYNGRFNPPVIRKTILDMVHLLLFGTQIGQMKLYTV